MQRRDFLRQGLAALGAVGGAAAVAGLGAGDSHGGGGGAAAAHAEGAAAAGAAAPVSRDEVTHALTPGGQVVHLHGGKVVRLPVLPSDAAARVGVPNRKWVMVIDLAKCDGCGKCME